MVCWLGLFHSEKKEVNMTLHPQTCANKIDRHDIAEILLNVALNTITLIVIGLN
jgi:hypothetical protein